MNRQPKWVPEWLWAEYSHAKTRQHALTFYDEDGHPTDGIHHFANPEELLSIMERLLNAPQCESLWRSLERRKGATLERYRQVLDADGIVSDRDFDALEAYYLGFDHLADTVCRGLHGPVGTDVLTASQRRQAAKKIRLHAGQLLQTLEETFTPDCPYLPMALFRLLVESGTLTIEINETKTETHRPEEPSVLEGLVRFPEILDLLGHAVEVWAEDKPMLARPNEPNAKRLFFIRIITGWFLERYGTPMREHTLAIASVFFDCSDLDAAAISKLAPCN